MSTKITEGTGHLFLFLMLALGMGCSKGQERRTPDAVAVAAVDAAVATPTAPSKPTQVPVQPDGEFPILVLTDCPGICQRLSDCAAGPFKSLNDCAAACEASIDDVVSGRTYSCVARAKFCKNVKRCGR